MLSLMFFFFQAEDGIRDLTVTGVQTCALPILIVVLSAAYFLWGQAPAVSKLFLGFVPAVTAVIVHAAWGMARKTILGLHELTIAVIAGLLLLYKGGFHIILIIIVSAGLIGWLSFAAFSNPTGEAVKNKPAR